MAMTVAATAALLGCSSLTPAPWRVEGVYRVEDSGAGTAKGYLALARQYEGEQRAAQALDAYRKAAQAAPEDADVQNTLGLALARQAQYGQAVLALRRAVALAPERAALLNNLGYALLLDGRAEEARAMFRLTLAVDPAHEMAARNLHWVNQPQVATAAPATPVIQVAPAAPAEAPAPLPPAVAALALLQSTALQQAVALPPVAALEPAASQVSMPAMVPLPAPVTAAMAAPMAASEPVAMAVATKAPEEMPPAKVSLEGVSIEIVNGNGITGAAARLRQWLGQQGIKAGRLANLLPYDTPQTQILYRPGRAGAAQAVAERMPLQTEVAPAPAGSTGADVHVLIGHDARYSAGCASIAVCATPERLASSLSWQARAAAGEVQFRR